MHVVISQYTGLGFGLVYLPAIISVSMYFEKRRALATGIAVCGSGAGTFLMAPLVHKLIDWQGWENAIIILGAIVLLCIPLGALFRPISGDNSTANTVIKVERQITERESTKDQTNNCKCFCNAHHYIGMIYRFSLTVNCLI